jgi:hypothetical protein
VGNLDTHRKMEVSTCNIVVVLLKILQMGHAGKGGNKKENLQ